MKKSKRMFRKLIKSKGLHWLFLTLTLFSLLGYLFVFRPARSLYTHGQTALTQAKKLKKAVKDQNLTKIKTVNEEIQQSITSLKTDLNQFAYLAHLPHLKDYYQDAHHLLEAGDHGTRALETLAEGIEPFAPVLGLEGTSNKKLSAQEKVAQLAQISPQLIPYVERAQTDLNSALQELNHIHPQIYPERIRGYTVRKELISLKEKIPQLQNQIQDAKPLLEEMPNLLGVNQPQNYLILFQNNKEIRPTGGFITAYAIVQMDKGYFSILTSDDIYNLDTRNSYLTPPSPIIQHLKQNGWWMRDTNFSPDYKKSMEDFMFYYRRNGTVPVKGVISLDTQLVEELLKLTGPIKVAGYSVDPGSFWNLPQSCYQGGEAFTAENVVCRLELYAEKILLGSSERKAIIGSLMEKMVDWALHSPPKDWPELIAAVINQVEEKHLLIYLENEAAQQLVEKYNWGGRIKDSKEDYLHINQANLCGLKSDLYMERRVKQEIKSAEDGTLTTKLTLTYNNTGAYDGWLNSTARNYLRVYVPLGSELISWSGGQYAQPNVYQDLGKTVFDNFFVTRPLSESVLTFEYKLPFTLESEKVTTDNQYQILIQKQPGLETPEYKVIFADKTQNFNLTTDKQVTFEL